MQRSYKQNVWIRSLVVCNLAAPMNNDGLSESETYVPVKSELMLLLRSHPARSHAALKRMCKRVLNNAALELDNEMLTAVRDFREQRTHALNLRLVVNAFHRDNNGLPVGLNLSILATVNRQIRVVNEMVDMMKALVAKCPRHIVKWTPELQNILTRI